MTIVDLLNLEILDEDGDIKPEYKKLIREIDKVMFTKGGQRKNINEDDKEHGGSI